MNFNWQDSCRSADHELEWCASGAAFRLLYPNAALGNAEYNVRFSKITTLATAFFHVPAILSARPLDICE